MKSCQQDQIFNGVHRFELQPLYFREEKIFFGILNIFIFINSISSESKFHGGLPKKSSRSDQPLLSLKPFPRCKYQSKNSRLNSSVLHQRLFEGYTEVSYDLNTVLRYHCKSVRITRPSLSSTIVIIMRNLSSLHFRQRRRRPVAFLPPSCASA